MKQLSLYNTKTKTVEQFIPLSSAKVTMYACGPTVYDATHIGHMRKYIGDDILRRTLTLLGYTVQHVMNITDVGHLTDDSDTGDDKFEKKAATEQKTVWEIAALYTDYFHTTMRAVGVLPPIIEAKATEHIPAMVALVQTLIEKGFAYETSEAIYFDTSKDPQYGTLSGQSLEQKRTNREDVVQDADKKHPADFSLWFKRVGRFAHHTMYWQSPWGDGFPGWHIECSAMSMQYLGETIDIHTGGIDHIPVHHENEIAQSECATGHEFVKYWVHHDFLLVDGEKMSKSKKNFYTIEDILEKGIDPRAVRILFMQTSYRKPLNFTWESLQQADTTLKKIYKYASHCIAEETAGILSSATPIASYYDEFTSALCEDLNTAKALAVVFSLLSDTTHSKDAVWATLQVFDTVLGLSMTQTHPFVITPEAEELLTLRTAARTAKDYKTSDELREKLESLGYDVLDTATSTTLY